MTQTLRRLAMVGGVALTLGAVVQGVLGFLAQLALMRLLVPEDFGRFAIAWAAISVVQTVLSLRISVLIIRLPDAELNAERRHQLQAALVWETLFAMVVTLVWLAVADLLSGYTLLLVAALSLTHWTGQAVAFFERSMAYPRLIAAETAAQVSGHFAAVAVAVMGGGAAALYVREAVAALARLATMAWIGAVDAPRFRLPRWFELRRLVKETAGFWTDGVLEGGFARIIILATGAVAGFHGTGLFSQSQRLATIPHQLAAPVTARLAVNVFSRTPDPIQRRRMIVRGCAAVLAIMAAAGTVTVVVADPIVPMLFGEHWRAAVPLLRAMTGVIVFLTAFELLRAYCFAVGRSRLVLIGRLAQYAAFGAFVAAALVCSDPVATLAWGLSAANAAGFLVIATLLAVRRADRPKEQRVG